MEGVRAECLLVLVGHGQPLLTATCQAILDAKYPGCLDSNILAFVVASSMTCISRLSVSSYP